MEEINLILQAADELMKRVILVLLYTGLRRSELLFLEWKDIDFDNGLINVQSKPEFGFHPKSYKPRSIPICSELRNLLLYMPQVGRFVFDNGNNDSLYQPNRFLKKLKKISKRAEIREVNLHTLRRTFASHLIMKGVDPRTVQEYPGHSSIQVTEKYFHLSKRHKFQAIQILNFNSQDGTKLTKIGRADR